MIFSGVRLSKTNIKRCKAKHYLSEDETDADYKDLHLKVNDHVREAEFKYKERSTPMRGLQAVKAFNPGEPLLLYSGEYLTPEQNTAARKSQLKHDCVSNYMIEMKTDTGAMTVDCAKRGGLGGLANMVHGGNNCNLTKVSDSYNASYES